MGAYFRTICKVLKVPVCEKKHKLERKSNASSSGREKNDLESEEKRQTRTSRNTEVRYVMVGLPPQKY